MFFQAEFSQGGLTHQTASCSLSRRSGFHTPSTRGSEGNLAGKMVLIFINTVTMTQVTWPFEAKNDSS